MAWWCQRFIENTFFSVFQHVPHEPAGHRLDLHAKLGFRVNQCSSFERLELQLCALFVWEKSAKTFTIPS